MYQVSCHADDEIVKDFSEIINKIIIDVYLKNNIFMTDKDKELLNLSQEEKIEFLNRKRAEILRRIQETPFTQEEYINSEETSIKLTSCVKCLYLGEYEDEYYEWVKDNPKGVYCDVCTHRQNDFKYC